MRDDKYTHGGTYAVDGEYEETSSVAARVGRLIVMHRGKWSGSGGITLGSRLHTIEVDSAENRAAIPAMVDEALQPLIDAGEITDIETEVVSFRDGAIGFEVRYTDKTTGDGATYSQLAPWAG